MPSIFSLEPGHREARAAGQVARALGHGREAVRGALAAWRNAAVGAPLRHAPRAGRRRVGLAPARRRVRREQRGRDRRRRRPDVVDTLMVRSQWEPFAEAVAGARPAGAARSCSRTRTSTTSAARRRSRTRRVFASPQTSELLDGRCPSTRTSRSCPRSRTSSTTSPSSARGRSPTSIDGAAQLTPRVEVLPASGHTDGDVMVLVADVDVLLRRATSASSA